MDARNGNTKRKDEFVRDWIENEVLYQVSLEKKLLKKNKVDKILENTEKEIAASLVIEDFLKSNDVDFSNTELESYFQKNKEDYSLTNDAYILNYIAFNDEESAIVFRNKALSSDWEAALDEFKENKFIIKNNKNSLFYLYNIQSPKLIRVIRRLYNNEISLIVKTELNHFVVVQLIEKIDKNQIPKFEYLRDKIKENYTRTKQKEFVKQYLDSLFAVKKIKIY